MTAYLPKYYCFVLTSCKDINLHRKLYNIFKVFSILTSPPPPERDPVVQCHGMKANPTGYPWSTYVCFLISGCQDMDF